MEKINNNVNFFYPSIINYLDEHVGKDAESHVEVGLRVGKLGRSLDIEGPAGGEGEGEGAEGNAHHLQLRWLAC